MKQLNYRGSGRVFATVLIEKMQKNKNVASGSAARSSKQYIYYNQLSFLNSLKEPPTDVSCECETNDAETPRPKMNRNINKKKTGQVRVELVYRGTLKQQVANSATNFREKMIKSKTFRREMSKPKVFFYIVWSTLALFILWLQLATVPDVIVNENIINEAIQNFPNNSKLVGMAQTTKLSEDLKYMLIWNQRNLAPLNKAFFRDGQESFVLNECHNTNCYVTTNRTYFGEDITKFDAIAFNGRNIKSIRFDLPKKRSPHQKYIYFNMESADLFPVCTSALDDFFNWTATYKLDSDIPFPYIVIKKNGKIVGPNVTMDWPAEFPKVSDEQEKFNKTKAAAWFVSRCHSRSKREDVVTKLQEALSNYGYSIDIYGSCGPLKCPRKNEDVCYEKLEKEYYFYLSMENSFSEDYVTEKLLTALLHDAVPIVYGDADYSRFLPPTSYIDAQKHNASSLAALMDQLIRSPSLYAQYFRWKQVYQYVRPQTTINVCNVCTALNNKEMFSKKTVYKEFRKWWLGSDRFKRRC